MMVGASRTALARTAAPGATELVVFDVDGTLVDSQHHILDAMRFAFGRAGLPLPTRETALGVVGLSLPQAMAALVPHLPSAEVEALVMQEYADQERQRGHRAGD